MTEMSRGLCPGAFLNLKEKIKTSYLYKKTTIILCINKGAISLTNQGEQGNIKS